MYVCVMAVMKHALSMKHMVSILLPWNPSKDIYVVSLTVLFSWEAVENISSEKNLYLMDNYKRFARFAADCFHKNASEITRILVFLIRT